MQNSTELSKVFIVKWNAIDFYSCDAVNSLVKEDDVLTNHTQYKKVILLVFTLYSF